MYWSAPVQALVPFEAHPGGDLTQVLVPIEISVLDLLLIAAHPVGDLTQVLGAPAPGLDLVLSEAHLALNAAK